jgi:hypothetical protein
MPSPQTIAYYTGVGVVVATHVWMLNHDLPEDAHTLHAYANLVAAGMILYGSRAA